MQYIRSVLHLFIMLVAGGSCAVVAQVVDPDTLLQTADNLAKEVSRVRELDFKPPVTRSIKNRNEIASFLHGQIREEYARDDLEKEAAMLRTLGLMPEAIDYRETLFKLLADPVESRYDRGKNSLYIASWIPSGEQKSVIAHELARALQQQHFNIQAIAEADKAEQNHDRSLAHRALLEGDRTVVMLQLQLETEKRHFSDIPNLAFVMQSWMATTQNRDEEAEKIPEYVKQILIFPYGYGAAFLQEVWKDNPGWQSINRIYSDLPVSTEQIMHPEKYFGVRDIPKAVTPVEPLARLGTGWRIVCRNVLGEFSLGLFLNLHLTGEYARKAASGWGGDEVVHLENESGDDAVLVNTVWDSEEDAEKFFTAMDTWFLKQFPKGKRKNETATGFSCVDDGKFYEIRRNGKSLYLLLGLPESDGRQWGGG